jgi:hypothetical protein
MSERQASFRVRGSVLIYMSLIKVLEWSHYFQRNVVCPVLSQTTTLWWYEKHTQNLHITDEESIKAKNYANYNTAYKVRPGGHNGQVQKSLQPRGDLVVDRAVGALKGHFSLK